MMNTRSWMEDLQKNMADLIARSPIADVERNVRAMMIQAFNKLDLVTREEFDIQVELLTRARTRVQELTIHIEQLEKRLDALEKLE